MTVMEKRVDESAVRIACRWMNYQADWFIDNRQILVLVKNMKGNLLRKDLGRSRLRDHHGDTVTRHHSGLGPGRLPVEQNVPAFQQALDAGAGELWQFPGEKNVESFASVQLDGDGHAATLMAVSSKSKC